MSTSGRHWVGVRLRTVEIGIDADAPARRVAIPAVWDDRAAAGFAGLCGDDAPGWAPVRLPDAAASWIERLTAAGRRSGLVVDPSGFGDALHEMLLLRRGCVDEGGWRVGAASGSRGFVLNLAAFVDPECGLDETALSRAATVAGLAAATAGGEPVRVADLDGMLARLGIGYGSAQGRTAARAVIAVVRAGAAAVGVSAGRPGWVDALLGVETAGLAPAFSPVNEDGRLTAAAVARLAAAGLSPERALAMTLDGQELPLAVADASAHAAMHDSLAPLLVSAPERPACAPRLAAASPPEPAPPHRRALPARSKGFTQKVTIGGHRLFLRTAEYGDGTLGEIAVTPAGREGGMSRGLAEAWASAVSIGLQHGVPLDAFVDAFSHARFGTGGAVEGDPSILAASSPLDYVMRALADAYLGRHLPDPAPDEAASEPLLPLGLRGGAEAQAGHASGGMRQRALRLVSPA